LHGKDEERGKSLQSYSEERGKVRGSSLQRKQGGERGRGQRSKGYLQQRVAFT